MSLDRNLWAIVLAAGEGTRLRELTTGPDGLCVPKQYCSINGGPSLLRQALARAFGLAGHDRTTVVVARSHTRWWSQQLADLAGDNVIVQPCNRGTACGLLLPLLTVLHRDPEATVLVLPSDHLVEDEAVIAATVERAFHALGEGTTGSPILLGVEPDRADGDYGWVVPGYRAGCGARAVKSFIEKPSNDVAEQLLRRGALWNSSIFIARARALLDLFETVMPWLVRLFSYALTTAGSGGRERPALDGLFSRLPTLDFSASFLQRAPDHLRVVPVPPCGWSDVGTPERIGTWMERRDSCPVTGTRTGGSQTPLDLADSLRARSSSRRP